MLRAVQTFPAAQHPLQPGRRLREQGQLPADSGADRNTGCKLSLLSAAHGWNYSSSDCQSSPSETCSALDKMSGMRKNKTRKGSQGTAASASCRCRGNQPGADLPEFQQGIGSRGLGAAQALQRAGVEPPSTARLLQDHGPGLHPLLCFPNLPGLPTSQKDVVLPRGAPWEHLRTPGNSLGHLGTP